MPFWGEYPYVISVNLFYYVEQFFDLVRFSLFLHLGYPDSPCKYATFFSLFFPAFKCELVFGRVTTLLSFCKLSISDFVDNRLSLDLSDFGSFFLWFHS